MGHLGSFILSPHVSLWSTVCFVWMQRHSAPCYSELRQHDAFFLESHSWHLSQHSLTHLSSFVAWMKRINNLLCPKAWALRYHSLHWPASLCACFLSVYSCVILCVSSDTFVATLNQNSASLDLWIVLCGVNNHSRSIYVPFQGLDRAQRNYMSTSSSCLQQLEIRVRANVVPT